MKSLEVAHLIRPGAIGLCLYHGSTVSRGIGAFQGRPGKHDDLPELSHGFVVSGQGTVVEQTWPRGREGSIGKFLGRDYTTWFFDPPWSDAAKAVFVAAMRTVTLGTGYSVGHIGLHLLDNMIERLTWDRDRQEGKRPISKAFRVGPRDRSVCTGAMGLAVYRAFARQINPDIQPGAERPLDWWIWARLNARFLGMNHLGEWYTILLTEPTLRGDDPNW